MEQLGPGFAKFRPMLTNVGHCGRRLAKVGPILTQLAQTLAPDGPALANLKPNLAALGPNPEVASTLGTNKNTSETRTLSPDERRGLG